MDIFSRLPPELRSYIIECLPWTDLVNWVRTCRRLYDMCVPVMYETIDLAAYTHTNDDPPRRQRTEPTTYRSRMERGGSPDKALYLRQCKFVDSLRRNPELASHVRTLRWSTVFNQAYCIGPRPDEDQGSDGEDDEDDYYVRQVSAWTNEAHFNLCNDALWDMFSLMKDVTTLDLSFVSDEHEREVTPPPPRLFEKAKFVTLSGLASRHLIKSLLLAIKPENLLSLHLDNLQEFAEFDNVPQHLPIWKKATTSPWPLSQSSNPGPMRGILPALEGRWPHLQSLSISTVSGKIDVREERSSETGGCLDEEIEDKRYSEIGSFLQSVSRSLRYFRFEQGRAAPRDRMFSCCGTGWTRFRAYCASLPTTNISRPMDIRFKKYILPVLLEDSWPRLKTLELYGVAGPCWIASNSDGETVFVNGPLDDETLHRIHEATRGVNRLILQPNATRFFWLTDGDCGVGFPDLDDPDI